MSDNPGAACNRDALLENFAAELTRAAYGVALRHATAGAWVDLELDLWKALADTVKTWGKEMVSIGVERQSFASRDFKEGAGSS